MIPAWSAQPESPPIAPPIVREGDFATRLVFELGMGTTDDEVTAETQLGNLGIIPGRGIKF